jgi:nitrite reductase/ring-hydroxylating ferredoxin subunit
MIERITSLSAPPVVGRWYLVPTVSYPWLDEPEPRPWPVFLPKHEDREHLNFEWEHFHVDPRFLSARLFERCITAGLFLSAGRHPDLAFAHCQRVPLVRFGRGREPILHGPVVWVRMHCSRSAIPYQFGDRPTVAALKAHFTGRQSKRARSGWVCPHKHFPLGSIAAVDGVITCPLHGLQVRESDGVVLSSRCAHG